MVTAAATSVAVTAPLAAAATTALAASAAVMPDASSLNVSSVSNATGSPLPMPPVVSDKPVTE